QSRHVLQSAFGTADLQAVSQGPRSHPMTTETDLLPCPFCGLDVTDDEGCFPLNREGTHWEVRCGNPSCFAHDPCDESMQAAVARWNRRATAARDAEIEALRAEVAEAREFRDKIANAIGNDQLRRFIENHG